MTARHKFLLAFFLLVSFLVVLTKVFDYHSQQMTILKQAIGHSYKLNSDVLLLRKNEKNFLTRLSWDELKKFEANANVLIHDVEYLKSLLIEDTDLAESLDKVQASLTQYKHNFELVCDRYQKIGIDYDHGMKGKTRQSFLKIEAFLWQLENQDPSLKEKLKDYKHYLLKLSLTEKNFLLRPSQKYVERFKLYLEKFYEKLDEDELFTKTAQQDFYDYTNEYSEDFLKLAENLINLDYAPDSPLITLSQSAHDIEHIVRDISSKIVDDMITSERGARTYSTLMMFCFVFGILSIATVPFLLLMFGNQPANLMDEKS
jgi:methyl-accepting chemotaxis protein